MRPVLAALLIACAAPVSGGSLERPTEVDLAYVDRQTGHLQLFVILDEPLDTRRAIRALYAKVKNYCAYVGSGRAVRDISPATSATGPTVTLMAPKEATPAETQNLQGVKLRSRKLGCNVDVQPFDANIKPSPRAIGEF